MNNLFSLTTQNIDIVTKRVSLCVSPCMWGRRRVPINKYIDSNKKEKEGMPASADTEIEATVGEVAGKGRYRFVVTYPTNASLIAKDEAITFSMSAWSGDFEPVKGQIVMLSNVERFVKGWRAKNARPVILSNKE